MHNTTDQAVSSPTIVVDPPVSSAPASVTPEVLAAMIEAATEAAVQGILAQIQASSSGPIAGARSAAEPRPATKPEACTAHKVLSLLNRGASSVIIATRDRIAVPANIYLTDQAAPQALALAATGAAVVASGAAKATGFFTRLAEKAAAKSHSMTVR